MKISIAGREVALPRWKPGMGRVFTSAFAFRGKGTPVDEARPWMPTTLVVGAACDGRRGCLVPRQDLEAFLDDHEDVPVILHDSARELEAIQLAAGGLDIYRRADDDLVEDVQVLHRLLALATEGHTDPDPARSTLASLARTRLGLDLPQGRLDSRGRPVDRSYGRWLNKPVEDIEPTDLDALLGEVVAVRLLRKRLRFQIRDHLAGSAAKAWGYVSPGWLAEQIRRWGPLTHHIQVKAAVVLRAATARGLRIDLGRRSELLAGLEAIVDENKAILRDLGYLPGQPSSSRALRSILGRIERRTGVETARTASGAHATSEEALGPLAATEPFVRAFLAHRAADQLRAAFVDKKNKRVLHPSFDPIRATTGRTSSFGELNSQDLPLEPRIRACVVPAPGRLLAAADFKAIEMVALGQALPDQFGMESRLAAALNAGKDPHKMVAALATGKEEAEVTPEERQKAKPVKFGLPGAMTAGGLKAYARVGYGVDLDDEEVEALIGAWFELFPEMREFLVNEVDLGLEVARAYGLTPASYLEHTGSRRFQGHGGDGGPEDEPSPILGGMFLKVLKSRVPATRGGRPYDAVELDYFWSRAKAKAGMLEGGLRAAVLGRRPSPRLQRAAMSLVDSGPVFTLTGRLRAGGSFPARHNTIFQGLASDGAKLALWKVWRAGYTIVNFIHDELVVEIPDGPDVDRDVREIRRLMIEGMQEVITDVRVEVECVVYSSWGGDPVPQIAPEGRRARAGTPESKP